jgi:hypothetical protein
MINQEHLLANLPEASKEVIRLYENLGLSVGEISEETGYELTAIKAILVNHSRGFQNSIRVNKQSGIITDDELEEFTGVIKSVARDSEFDHLRLKAAMYLRDDKLGRHDVIKEGGNLVVNVLTLNAGLKKLKQLKQMSSNGSMNNHNHQTPNPTQNYSLESSRSSEVELELVDA